MSTRDQSDPASVEEMILFLSPVFAQAGVHDTLSIPGMDAYVPSFVAGGADERRTDGQLESDSRRDKQD